MGRAVGRRGRGAVGALWLAGLLTILLGGGALAAGPALASLPLSWSAPALIGPEQGTPAALNGVSCPSASLCVAVDAYGNVVSSTEPTNAGSWRVSRAYVNRTGSFSLSAVSCAAIDFCLASGGGTFRSSTDPAGGAGAWSSHATPQESVPLSVSCPSRELCVGVTYHGEVWSSTEPRGDRLAWKTEEVDEHHLSAVSCPSLSLCVAVDTEGDVLSTTEPTGGKAAWHLAAADPGHAMRAISCASESLCVAVDEAGDVLSSSHPTGGAGAWSVSEVEKGVVIRGVSCFSESLCVAVDEAGDILASTHPTGGASAWSVAHVDEHALQAVSCASASLCVATGTDGDVLTTTDPSGPAVAWALAHVDTMTSPPLAAVSCASASLCIAGLYTTVLTSTDPAGGAGAWRLETSPKEGPASVGLGLGLSCPSASLCVAAGDSSVSASTEPAGGAPTWTEETGWFYPPQLEPEAEYFGPSGAVSCTTGPLCVADGDTFNDFNTLTTSTDPTGGAAQWHETHIQGSGNKVSPPFIEDPILGVSCAFAALCVAVDAAGNVLTSTDPTSSDSTWTIAPVDTHPLEGVSCPSEDLCVAVDDAGNVVTSTNPTGGSAAWTVSSIDSSYVLTGISCPTTSLCVAVDDEGNALTSTDPTGGAGGWSASDVDSSASASRALTAISCLSEELCVAVDNAGYAVTGTAQPPTKTGNGGEEGGGGQAGGTTTSTTSTTSTAPPPPPPGVFKVLGVKVGGGGQIVVTLNVPAAGSFDALATASIREAAGGSRKKTKHKAGHAHKITYGAGSARAHTAGLVTLTIRPTKSALGVLKSLRTLRVPVTVIFQPRSGSPTTASETVIVRYHSPRRSRACSASKGACRGKR